MNVEVTRDTSKRIIEMNVSDVPRLQVTRPWHTRPRLIQPQRAVLVILSGQTVSIKVSGGQILGDGTVSEKTWSHWEWVPDGQYGQPIGKAPDWVRQVWEEAPLGVFAWSQS